MIELSRSEYQKYVSMLDDVGINTMFAQAVLKTMSPGTIYVDNPHAPRVFYIVNKYGMSLLYGDPQDVEFEPSLVEYVRTRSTPEWMQAYPPAWDAKLARLLSSDAVTNVEFHRRVNFRFYRERFAASQPHIPEDMEIQAIGSEHFQAMSGSVVPFAFWNDAAGFLAHGAGFELLHNGQVVCQAFSSAAIDRRLEIGIETLPAYRGKGLARYACARLIEYCLNHELEPVWACRAGNIGSVRLAQSLGFEALFELPYYRLG